MQSRECTFTAFVFISQFATDPFQEAPVAGAQEAVIARTLWKPRGRTCWRTLYIFSEGWTKSGLT